MKKFIFLLICALLMLIGCEAAPPEPTPEPTPNVYLEWSGEWTREEGDGGEVWHLKEDGTVRLPTFSPDGYGEFGGYGTWMVGDTLSVDVGKSLTLHPVQEDSFTKLYCKELNTTLVRCSERAAAYGAKFTEVQLTDENFRDYFYFEQVPEPVDENGERIWQPVYVMRSGAYEDGLLYWGDRDVFIDLTYWTSYHFTAEKAPFGVTFLVDGYQQTEAEGTLVFIKSDHLAEQFYDGEIRRLVCNTGQVWERNFDTHRYDGYPY